MSERDYPIGGEPLHGRQATWGSTTRLEVEQVERRGQGTRARFAGVLAQILVIDIVPCSQLDSVIKAVGMGQPHVGHGGGMVDRMS